MIHSQTRDFIISIDGTGNDPTDKNISNVLKLHRALDHRQPHQPDVTAPLLKFTLNLPRRAREIMVMAGNRPTDIPPKIHHTVFDRMAALGSQYQPENILALGGRFQKIEPGDAA